MGDNGTPSEVIQPPYTPDHAKSTLYQGGIHVPLIIADGSHLVGRDPEPTERVGFVTNPGRTESSLVLALDLFATIADIAGVDVPDEDSVSLLPYLEDRAQHLRDFVYTESFRTTEPGSRQGTARDERFKILFKAPCTYELYDLLIDPWETTDLYPARQAQAQASQDALIQEMIAIDPTYPSSCQK